MVNGPGTRFVPGPFHTTTDSCSVPTISARHAEPIREIRGIARVIRVRPFPTRTGRDADPSRPDALIAIRRQVPAYLHERLEDLTRPLSRRAKFRIRSRATGDASPALLPATGAVPVATPARLPDPAGAHSVARADWPPRPSRRRRGGMADSCIESIASLPESVPTTARMASRVCVTSARLVRSCSMVISVTRPTVIATMADDAAIQRRPHPIDRGEVGEFERDMG